MKGMYYKPQVTVLKALLDSGKPLRMVEISEITGIDKNNCHGNIVHLRRRDLIKIVDKVKLSYMPLIQNVYALNEKKMEKIQRLVSELGNQEEQKNVYADGFS